METLNLQPPTMEWRVYRNDNATMTLVLVDSNGAALDLTGWSFTGVVREYPKDAAELSQLSIVKVDNVLTVGLDTSDLTLIAYFDIEGSYNAGAKISTVIRGQIFVEEDVTR
jgi:hypothetical protein